MIRAHGQSNYPITSSTPNNGVDNYTNPPKILVKLTKSASWVSITFPEATTKLSHYVG